MEETSKGAAGKSPRSIAVEQGFELVETAGGTFCYEHPESKIGVLIDIVKDEVTGKVSYDWSIHEPDTGAVVAAQWGEPNGEHFLRQLIQAGLDLSPPSSSSDSSVEEKILKGKCKSCNSLRKLDSNGYCYFC